MPGRETPPLDELQSDLFSSRGECAALMRGIDWPSTPLGSPTAWPQSLRTIVPIMLASRFAMRVLWGPEFIFLYNDSYRPILGASKHPSAMASRTSESFRELWHVVGPLFERVYAGEAIALEDTLLPLDRNGYLEECYFTLSYSPMLDDSGNIGGVLGVVHETTEHVVAARRLRTLRDLASGASAVGSPEAACDRAVSALAQNPTDVPFALLYVVSSDGLRARLTARTGLDAHPEVCPEVIKLGAPSGGTTGEWELGFDDHSPPTLIDDVVTRFGAVRSGPYAEPIQEAMIFPIRKALGKRSYGFLILGISPRRRLNDAYRGFLELATEQITNAVSSALEHQERERLIARESAAEARLRLLFNEAPASIAVLSGPDHVFELANPRYCQLVGRDQLLGRPGREALPELVEQGVWDLFDRVYTTGQPFVGKEFEAKLDRLGDGTLVVGYFNFVIQPTRDLHGRIEGTMLFAIEISEQVVARRAEQSARAEAEASSRAKDDFLAIVSHELRNPLSAILGWARLLRRGTLSPEKSERAVETIERNALAQSQLIDDLLDVSRIISGKLRLEVRPVNFGDIVQAAIDSARLAIDSKQLRLRTVLSTDALSLMGDPTRLQQVVWNLLSNAARFTPKGGSIQVVLRRVESILELEVRDTGDGIAADFLPHIFDRFRQADPSTTRAHGGLGLGLSIARNLVEMHGGTISAHSPGAGQGASFVVRLPVAPLRKATTEPRATLSSERPHDWECPQELMGLRVLVVDDETDTRDMIAEVLTQCGCRVDRAASAHEALALLEASRPDLLLSDIGMPNEDGYALIRRVRELPPEKGGSTPAASLTAYASGEDRRRALLAGFNMHVPKPVEPSELVAVVASLGRIARALR
jgi:PAS domain S-box-containing protein